MTHTLYTAMELALPVEKVFEFFSDASNIQRITPGELGFEIITPHPISIKNGTTIDYRIRIAGIPVRWRSLISCWNPPHGFIDEQIHGPYKRWKHTHRFELTEKGTRIADEVQYALPMAPFGELAFPFVKMQLNRIFTFRQTAIEKFFTNQ